MVGSPPPNIMPRSLRYFRKGPADPSGRYLIAFREASNAIKAVGRIPIPSEKYPNGLRLKLTFDPASGIGFD